MKTIKTLTIAAVIAMSGMMTSGVAQADRWNDGGYCHNRVCWRQCDYRGCWRHCEYRPCGWHHHYYYR